VSKREYIIVAVIMAAIIAIPLAIATINSLQKVNIIVDAPSNYEIGQLVILDASASKADELIWKIFPATENFKVQGTIALFASGQPIDYTIIVVARRGKHLACKVLKLKHGNSDKVINTLTPFEQEVKKWLPPDKAGAKELAQSFKIVAGTIDSGVFDTVDGVIMATARANSAALGDRLGTWKPFLQRFQEYLETNPPATIADHSTMWKNMAVALEKA